jgi:polysaccharide export outer membrane protein
MNSRHAIPVAVSRIGLMIITTIASAAVSTSAKADGAVLAPQTKFRLSIVQWAPAKGQYERWDAFSGDYTVSDKGQVLLPSIGAITVGQLDIAGLTDEIAKRLQNKIRLNQPPAVSVEVLDYAPVYVVGDVAKPGEYRYREGLTVLQSLAMSGGPIRALAQQRSQAVRLAGDLHELDYTILRKTARLARLQAEMSGADDIAFDPAVDNQPIAEGILREERVIFQARANALNRRANALTELRTLLLKEISTLEEKLKGSDEDIRSIEEQLANMKSLVERGITVASRQLDLERLLTTYRSNRLDLVTAVMRGRQAISETTRDLEGLYDTRRSEIAVELQSDQASLDQLKMKQETTRKLLMEELSSSVAAIGDQKPLPTSFKVSRRDNGQFKEFDASEITTLLPGDVVKVVQPLPLSASLQAAPNPTPEAQTNPAQESQ